MFVDICRTPYFLEFLNPKDLGEARHVRNGVLSFLSPGPDLA